MGYVAIVRQRVVESVEHVLLRLHKTEVCGPSPTGLITDDCQFHDMWLLR